MVKIIVIFCSLLVTLSASAAQLNLYTDRSTAMLQPLVAQFKQQTGIEVSILELPYKDLLAKLKSEGNSSPADVIFTKDLVFQTELARLGFYQPMTAKADTSSAMRDPQNLWTAVTFRARTLVYDPSRSDVSAINSYEDLSKPEMAGRLCLRTSNNSYNEAMVASFIHTMGYDKAREVLSGMVENLAVDVVKGDTALLEAIANGNCEFGLANHYYLAQLIAQKPSFPVAIKFLEQAGSGVHVNGSGVGISSSSKNVDTANEFIQFLLSEKAQMHISSQQFDYPVLRNLLPSTLIKNWGVFKADNSNWTDIGNEVERARTLVNEIGYR